MIMACGAENRIAKKYADYIEDTKRHSQKMGPLVALSFSLIVSIIHVPLVSILTKSQFFGAFAAFGLAFWYGTKAFSEGRLDDVGTIVV